MQADDSSILSVEDVRKISELKSSYKFRNDWSPHGHFHGLKSANFLT